ncbi:MAG: preprotein translocase subunit SecG [Chloroflexi bacterium]|nr:preprotein translocase subunit SecG [Chloroflexota bacterium]
MLTYFYIMQIVVAATLIALVLLQAREGGLSSIFGGEGGVYKTRRGVEKTLFQATVGLSIAFFILAIATVLMSR